MKINWFSPLLPAMSGVAQYTRDLVEILSKTAEVTVWTEQTEWDLEIERFATVRYFQSEEWYALNKADINIYNIGNNLTYHAWIWDICRQQPGIIILHDPHLHHFFCEYYLGMMNDTAAYQNALTKYHGEYAKNVIKYLLEGHISHDELNANYPLTMHALENSLGVLVHTQEAFDYIKKYKIIPVLHQNLPYAKLPPNKLKMKPERPYKIIIFGYLGQNRGLESCLQALGEFPDKQAFKLDIYGKIWNREIILELIIKLDLEDLVILHDYVENDKLETALSEADLAVNLRFPSVGEVSHSQLQIWKHQIPSIVTSVGWYATLPPNTVYFVRPGKEVEDLQKHFADFLLNPEVFQTTGINGKQYLIKYFSPHDYCNGLIKFSEYIKKQRTLSAGFSLLENIIPKIRALEAGDSIKSKIAEKFAALFK